MLNIETGDKNPILRRIAYKIEAKDFKKAIKVGKEMMKYIKEPDNGGVGLAAPQVGHSIRLIVVSLLKDWEDEDFKTVIMINPEIFEFSEEHYAETEGCLSVPSKKGKVERAIKIKLKYQDDKNNIKTLILENLSARIVQHEVDHINGILFTDKIV